MPDEVKKDNKNIELENKRLQNIVDQLREEQILLKAQKDSLSSQLADARRKATLSMMGDLEKLLRGAVQEYIDMHDQQMKSANLAVLKSYGFGPS